MRIHHINKTYRKEVLSSENGLLQHERVRVRRLVKLNCFKTLKYAYEELTQNLNKKYPDVVLRTNSEFQNFCQKKHDFCFRRQFGLDLTILIFISIKYVQIKIIKCVVL